jgi:outer membrane protein assembly factor BamB/orotate phosphoribosyltransferase
MNGESFKKLIAEKAFVTMKEELIMGPNGMSEAWLFDFRRILLKSETLHYAARALFDEAERLLGRFQVGGMESAAIPLIAGVVLEGRARGVDTNGFYIRKSRKKLGLMRSIEGTIHDTAPIVLLDDLINTGSSTLKQVKILEEMGKTVSAVFTILRFRDLDYYDELKRRGIRIFSLYTLDDFANTLGVTTIAERSRPPIPAPFEVEWYFKSEHPNFFHVNPKSAPLLDESKIYFGSDSGTFWALNKSDGSVAWQHTIRFGADGKYIFSSPAGDRNTVYFGGYDGNFYALDKATGKQRWIFMEADWIGSSPALASDNSTVYVGLEFGLIKKQGGVVAINTATGKKLWEYRMPGLTHGSPAYVARENLVVCGSNEGIVYGLEARTGGERWKFPAGVVKASFAVDEDGSRVACGSFDGRAYVLETATGALIRSFETLGGLYSTPALKKGKIYAGSMDKNVYCWDIASGRLEWSFLTQGRVFASPLIVGNSLYIGSNDGKLYELDCASGKQRSFFQTTERIVNRIAYDETSGRIFLPTFANEIYCLRRVS